MYIFSHPELHRGKRCLYAILIAALFLTPALGLSAQEASPDSVDVVITAGRTEEAELSAPAQVTVISSEEIMDSGEQSLVGVLDCLAGVHFTSCAGPERASIDMRGFGENSSGRVLVMVDGRRVNSQDMQGIQWLSIPLESIERVEVVRGSESVLYGNHAVGGVINVITKDSEKKTEFASSIDFGSYYSENYNNAVFTSQRMRFGSRQGDVDGAVTFAHSSNEGHRDRSENRTVNTQLDGGWDITEILRGELDLGYNWTSYQMPGALPESRYGHDPSISDKDADEAENYELFSRLSIQWFPFYSTQIDIDGGYRYQSVVSNWESMSSYSDRVYHTIEASPKVTVEGEIASLPWSLVAGSDIYRSEQKLVDFAELSRDTKNYGANLALKSVGAYIRPAVDLTKMLRMEGGARYEQASISGVKEVSKSETVDGDDTHHAFVYDGAVLFRPAEGLKIYGKGGTLYRYPFTDEQAVVTGFDDGFNKDLKPETGVTAEAGSTLILEDLLSFRADGYYLLMQDEIAWNDPDGMLGPEPGKNVNMNETRRWGADAELEMKLHRRIGLSAAYGFVDARFSSGEHENNSIPLVPSHSFDGRLELEPLKGLIIAPESSFRSKRYKSGDDANEFDKLEAYWLGNLEVSYSPRSSYGDMKLKLKVENIFDTVYSTFAVPENPDPVFGSESSYYPAPGRSVSIVASYSY